MLIGPFGTPIDHPPVRWRLDMQVDSVRLVAHDIHEDLSTRVVGMPCVELRVCSGEIIPEHAIGRRDDAVSLPLDTPRLVVELVPLQPAVLRACIEFLNVLCKIRARIAAGLPHGHLKIDECGRLIRGNGYINRNLEQVRSRMRHREFVADAV